MYILTARIRRMEEGNIFTLCVSPHLDGGGGVPQPGLDGGRVPGPPPGQVLLVGGVPWPGLDGGGVPQPGLDGEGDTQCTPPGQVWLVGGTPPHHHDWMGYPPPP